MQTLESLTQPWRAEPTTAMPLCYDELTAATCYHHSYYSYYSYSCYCYDSYYSDYWHSSYSPSSRFCWP